MTSNNVKQTQRFDRNASLRMRYVGFGYSNRLGVGGLSTRAREQIRHSANRLSKLVRVDRSKSCSIRRLGRRQNRRVGRQCRWTNRGPACARVQIANRLSDTHLSVRTSKYTFAIERRVHQRVSFSHATVARFFRKKLLGFDRNGRQRTCLAHAAKRLYQLATMFDRNCRTRSPCRPMQSVSSMLHIYDLIKLRNYQS